MNIQSLHDYFRTSVLWKLFGDYTLSTYVNQYINNPQMNDLQEICSTIEHKRRNKRDSISNSIFEEKYKAFTENEIYQKYLLIPEDLRLLSKNTPESDINEFREFFKRLQNTKSIDEAKKTCKNISNVASL